MLTATKQRDIESSRSLAKLQLMPAVCQQQDSLSARNAAATAPATYANAWQQHGCNLPLATCYLPLDGRCCSCIESLITAIVAGA